MSEQRISTGQLLSNEAPLCVCGSDHLCGCGCGEELNPNLRRAHELVAAGATHAQAAAIMGVCRETVSILHRKPPRYVKGHLSADLREQGRAKQLQSNASRREAEFRSRRDGALRSAVERIQAGDTRFLYHADHWSTQLIREHRPDLYAEWLDERVFTVGWRRFFHAIAVAASREIRKLEREERRNRQLEHRWTRKAVAAQHREMRERDRARSRATRDLQRRVNRETADDKSYVSELSLDVVVQDEFNNGLPYVDFVQSTRSEPLEEIQRQHLWQIVGDLRPEDIGRMDQYALERLQKRLLDEGLVDIRVSSTERDRLRDENRHSGGSIPKMGRKRSGRRTRKQQQQVTVDHKVRDLPAAAKKEHRELRRVRRERDAA